MRGAEARMSSVRPVEGNLPTHTRRQIPSRLPKLCFHYVGFQALHECDNVITFLLGNL
jgi:hypothetical protein